MRFARYRHSKSDEEPTVGRAAVRLPSLSLPKGRAMSYRVHCDWCGVRLAREDDQTEMSITTKHRGGKSHLEARWSEEVEVTRHFCASPKEDTDRGGRDRAGLVPEREFDSCYHRAIAAITGTEVSDPGMGMEWRLVPVEDAQAQVKAAVSEPKAKKAPVPAPPPADPQALVMFGGEEITAELRHVIAERIAPSCKFVLPRMGIVSLDQVAAMSDEDLLALDGVGPRMVEALRDALADRPGQRGTAVVREAFGVIVHGMDKIDRSDPMYAPLSRALEPLTNALAEAVA